MLYWQMLFPRVCESGIIFFPGPRHFADVLELAVNSISVKVSDIIPLELIQGHG